MSVQKYLQIPGPINIPDRIHKAMLRPLINHRSKEFRDLLKSCLTGLRRLLHTDGDVFIFPSSGSGALESVIVNFLSTGDQIVTSSIGVFGERFAEIAEAYGVKPLRIEKEWGHPVDKNDVRFILEADRQKEIKLVCIPQSETTVGVASDIKAIAEVIKELQHPALLVVDSVSAFACMPLKMDEWGADVVVTASQKGLMLPPGFSIVALGKKAQALNNQPSKLPKWYWDYAAMRERLKEFVLPYTPPTMLLFGLEESIKMIEEEGVEKVWDRHYRTSLTVRAGVREMGLEPFVSDDCFSHTVTSVKMPEKIGWMEFSSHIESFYGVVLGGGLGKLSGKLFRIGHMGELTSLDVYAILGAIKMTLKDLGYRY